MIPIEKLIPIEQKAREYGYETRIRDGGRSVHFTQYKNGGHFMVLCDEGGIKLWNPSNSEVTIETYNMVLDDQNKLLELAMLLQENIIDDKIEDDV